MTVGELIAALQKHPPEMRVVIVYDSAVCNEDITAVSQWRPDAYVIDDPSKAEVVVGLFDEGSGDDFRNDAEDKRLLDPKEQAR